MARSISALDERKITRRYKDGRGQGRGAKYQPWITVRDVPSRGRSQRIAGRKTARVHQFLSDLELRAFLLFDWEDSVSDIREQFPLDRDETQRIAKALGVRHPVYRKTQTPFVMTTDLLIDVLRGGKLIRLARCVKPTSELNNQRVLEKLEIERRYWHSKKVEWGIVTERDLPLVIARNLARLNQYLSLDGLDARDAGHLTKLRPLIRQRIEGSSNITIGEFAREMDHRLHMTPNTALSLVWHLLANKVVTCDMSQVIDDTVPLNRLRWVDAVRERASA